MLKRKIAKKMMVLGLTLSLIGSMFAGLPHQATAASATKVIALDPYNMKKEWDGWGTALAWFGNVTGGWKNEQAKEQLVDALYSEEGLNYNIVRYNIGGGDDPNHTPYMRQGGAVPGFSTGFDENGDIIFNFEDEPDANQRWWLLEAKKRLEGRGDRFISEAFSNSAPYYMTHSGYTSGHTNATTTNLKNEHFTDFADYLATVVKYYKDEHGHIFDTLSPVNEPNTNYWRAGGRQEGSHWSPAMQAWIIRESSEALERLHLRDEVNISAMEESVIDTFLTNWNQYTDETKAAVDQMNVHAYGGSKRVEVRQLAERENKKLWMSEVDLGPSGVAHNHNNITPALALADQIMVDIKWFEPQAWVLWQAIESESNMLPDQENMNWGLIHADFDTEQWWYTKKYYAMAQFSKFIPHGSRFFENNDGEGRTLTAYSPENSEVVIVYRNPDSAAVQLEFDISKFAGLGTDVDVYTTSANKNLALSTTTVGVDKLTAEVEARSITTFVIKDVDAEDLLTNLKTKMDDHLQLLEPNDPDYSTIEQFIGEAEDALQQNKAAITEAYVIISRQFEQFSTGAIPKSGMSATATSYQMGEGPELTIDGSTSTMWHTSWNDDHTSLPHSITYDLGQLYKGVHKLEYVPRQDKDTNGIVTEFMIEASEDGTNYVKVAEGTWAPNKQTKTATFTAVNASHVRFTALASLSDPNYQYGSAAEITLYRNMQFTVNKDQLIEAIASAESFIEQYTRKVEYLDELKALVARGEELLDSNVATQESIDGIVSNINEEINRLEQGSFQIKDIGIKFAPLAYSTTPASNMVDGNRNSFYETNWEGTGYRYTPGDYIVIDLQETRENIGKIVYTPRQDMTNGRISKFNIYTSTEDLTDITLTGSHAELQQYFELSGIGSFDPSNSSDQTATFTSKDARYLAIQAFTTGGNATTLTVAELAVYEMEVNDSDTSELESVYEQLLEFRDSRGEIVKALINEALHDLPALDELDLITREAFDSYAQKIIGLYESYSNFGNVKSIRNGEIWVDTDGVPIQAHGGGVLFDEKSGTYYWYGEDKTENNLTGGAVVMTGIHAYSSTDLYNWKNEGVVLPVFNNVRFGADDLPTDDQPLYLSEDSEEYINFGEEFSYEKYQALPEITDRNDYYTGTLKSPYETLKKHNSAERIAELNTLYEGYTNEEKQAMYRDYNWDKVIERPKVIYNEKNDNYVMWWHHDGPKAGSYWTAEGGVAVSDSPNGPFKYLKTIRMPNDGWTDGNGNDGMLRDMTLFVDDDGEGYLIYSSEENTTTIILRLDEDYTGPATNAQGVSEEGVHWVKAHSQKREAPTLFKQDGMYYMITSGLTGWNPNPAQYHTATHIFGPWVMQGDPFIDDVNGTTHQSQSTFVLPYRDANGQLVKDKFIFMADRWVPSNLKDSRYIWFPLHLDSENQLIQMSWKEEWTYADEFGEEEPEPILVDVETITVTSAGDATEIKVKGGTLQMNAAVSPENATKQEVTWSVYEADGITDTGKATISASGLLSANHNGDVKVVATATDGSGVYGSKVIKIRGQNTGIGGGGGTGSEPQPTPTPPVIEEEDPAPTAPDPQPETSFTDVKGHWASNAIKQALAKGIIKGYSDQTFRPNAPVNREEFIVMLVRTLQPEQQTADGSEFTDSNEISSWAREAIAYAKQNGIVNGYTDGSFRPKNEITRAEMAMLIVNSLQLTVEGESNAPVFADDQDIPSWAKSSVYIAAQHGIVKGRPNNSFDPNATATRAESIAMLLRLWELKE